MDESRPVMFVVAIAVLAITAGHIFAAQGVPQPAFDVASVRRVTGSSQFPPLSSSASGDFIGRQTLKGLISWAYEVETYERIVVANTAIAGRLEELYELNAKPPRRTPAYTRADRLAMLRGLLNDRFGLKIRIDHELANVTVLRAIQPGAYGRALRPAPEGCEPLPAGSRGGDPKFRDAYLRNCRITYFDEHVRGTATLDEFARSVSFLAQRPILNRTELEGMFAIDVTIGNASFPPVACPGCGRPLPVESNGPAFNDAMRDQMRLTARQERQPIRLFIVEDVGPLVEN